MLDSALFYFFAGIAVASAALMVTRRKPLHSCVFFATTLLATAGIFLQLRATFLFFVQLLLFAGGILALFIFGISAAPREHGAHAIKVVRQKYVALLVALALGVQIGVLYWFSRRIPGDGLLLQGIAPADKLPPNLAETGRVLFASYVVAFEMAAVLLLVAMIGAMLMSKKRSQPQ